MFFLSLSLHRALSLKPDSDKTAAPQNLFSRAIDTIRRQIKLDAPPFPDGIVETGSSNDTCREPCIPSVVQVRTRQRRRKDLDTTSLE